MKCLIAAAVLTLLAGCATTEKYEENLQGWVGKPELELVRVWGAPNSVYETGGVKFLTYAKTRQGYIPGAAPSYQTQVVRNTVFSTPVGGYPGRSVTRQCDTTFEVSAGVVSSYRFEGNACKAK